MGREGDPDLNLNLHVAWDGNSVSGLIMTESLSLFPVFRMGEKDALASPNGVDGKYRRTASSPPPPSEKPNPRQGSFSTPTSATNGSSNGHASHSRQGSNSSSNGGNKTPAKTPKRESPATIAAKGKREI